MYFGLRGWLACSEDLIHWEPVLDDDGRVKCLFTNLTARYDVMGAREAGAGAILTEAGIVYLCNVQFPEAFGDLPAGSWAVSQALVSSDDLLTVLDMLPGPYMVPEYPWEISGHCAVPALVCNTIVHFGGSWRAYYGAADRCIGMAQTQTAPVK
jgi:predicted GH43/DUF377 family glycosyl hydrolase